MLKHSADDDATRPAADALSAGAPGRGAWDGLPVGTRLLEFEILEVVGGGGFGVVYRAYDHDLQREVALKEYLPASLARRAGGLRVEVTSPGVAATFATGLRSFVNEARLLAQFDHPSLVKVYRFWEGNGTAYMIMPYYRAPTLGAMLRERATPPDERWLRVVFAHLLDALEVLHARQCLHRDIAPDNILMLDDERPLLLDFGAARRVLADASRALTVIYKPTYAPIEQHAEAGEMKQGPWTDFYALAGVAHLVIVGTPPPSALQRLVQDTYEPLVRRASGRFDRRLLEGIDHALRLRPEARPQSVAALRAALGLAPGAEPSRPAVLAGVAVPEVAPAEPVPRGAAALRGSRAYVLATAALVAVALGAWTAWPGRTPPPSAALSPAAEHARPGSTVVPPSGASPALAPSGAASPAEDRPRAGAQPVAPAGATGPAPAAIAPAPAAASAAAVTPVDPVPVGAPVPPPVARKREPVAAASTAVAPGAASAKPAKGRGGTSAGCSELLLRQSLGATLATEETQQIRSECQ
jgi:hypothetical protein